MYDEIEKTKNNKTVWFSFGVVKVTTENQKEINVLNEYINKIIDLTGWSKYQIMKNLIKSKGELMFKDLIDIKSKKH